MTIANLFARIGVKTDEPKVKSFMKSVGAAKLGLVAKAGAAVGVAESLRRMTKAGEQTARELREFEAATGASTERLQQWQQVADRVSGSGDAVASSIRSIVDEQQAIRMGEGDVSAWQLLGIDPRGADPFEVMEELRRATADMAPAMRRDMMQRIGVSEDLNEVLQLTNSEFEELAGQAHIMDPAMIEGLERSRAAGEAVRQSLTRMRDVIAVELAPVFEDISGKLDEFIRQNQDGIVRAVRGSFDMVQRFISALRNAGRLVDSFIQATVGWEAALIGFGAVLGVAFAPITKITLGLILLIALLDDIYRYTQGRPSLIGDLAEDYPMFEAFIDGLVSDFERVRDFVQDLVQAIAGLLRGNQDAFDDFRDDWGELGEQIADVANRVNTLNNNVQELLNQDISAWGFLWQNTLDNIANSPGMRAIERLREWMQGMGRDTLEDLDEEGARDEGFFDRINPFSMLQSAPATGGGGGGVITQNNRYEIHGSDARAIGEEVSRRTQRNINRASAQRSAAG